jgi:hypothetical protein
MWNVGGKGYRLFRFGWGNLQEYDNLVAPVLGAKVIKIVLNVG